MTMSRPQNAAVFHPLYETFAAVCRVVPNATAGQSLSSLIFGPAKTKGGIIMCGFHKLGVNGVIMKCCLHAMF